MIILQSAIPANTVVNRERDEQWNQYQCGKDECAGKMFHVYHTQQTVFVVCLGCLEGYRLTYTEREVS